MENTIDKRKIPSKAPSNNIKRTKTPNDFIKEKGESLSKSYSEINLLLCKFSVSGNCIVVKNSKNNASINQNVRRVDIKMVDMHLNL